jgi:hypothetical protein
VKLLYYTDNDEDSIDECLMVVPDEYDEELAEQTAAKCLNDPVLECTCAFDELLGDPVRIAEYRPYVG